MLRKVQKLQDSTEYNKVFNRKLVEKVVDSVNKSVYILDRVMGLC